MTVVLSKKDVHLGGFAGLKEHRMVVDKKVGGQGEAWDGLGNFVYLADAIFVPYGQTNMHPHKELDVISVMVEGRIAHEGSLEHGEEILTDQVQVQRAGGEGFRHNEINPDSLPNRMIQLWVLPERQGEPAGYKLYNLKAGQLTQIYGGSKNQNETFYSSTIIEVGLIKKGQEINKSGEFIAYITRGKGQLNGIAVTNGDIVRADKLAFKAQDNNTQIIIVSYLG